MTFRFNYSVYSNLVHYIWNQPRRLFECLESMSHRIECFSWFLYAFISFTFQGWIRYQSFCSGRTPGVLVKTIKYLKFQIILVILVCNLTLPLILPSLLLYLALPHITLPYLMSYHTLLYLTLTLPSLTLFTSYLTLPYHTIPYHTITLCLTLPYTLSYLTLHFTLPYLTLCLTLPYLTLLYEPYLMSYLTVP